MGGSDVPVISIDTAKLPRTLSTSQVTTYTTCPRKYAYQYVLKVPTLVTPEPLVVGSRIHAAIAEGTTLDDPAEQAMVERAHRLLKTWPAGAIQETTFDDQENPGRLYGEIAGEKFVGIFDVHWKDPSIAVDWKTGTYKPKYTTALETQAYVMGELYAQTYDMPLEVMAFIFLKTGDHHYAKALSPGVSRSAAEKRVEKAICGIRNREYGRKQGPLCRYCEHHEICKMEVGFR